MGCYLYSVRRTKPVHVYFEGEWQNAHRLAFLRKPWYQGWDMDAGSRILMARAWSVWQKEGLAGRLVVLTGDTPAAGDTVIRLARHTAVWDDCGDLPGEVVGNLEPFGGAWRVRAKAAAAAPAKG
jgi:hypothetical protein